MSNILFSISLRPDMDDLFFSWEMARTRAHFWSGWSCSRFEPTKNANSFRSSSTLGYWLLAVSTI
jgi:hypothetical protein